MSFNEGVGLLDHGGSPLTDPPQPLVPLVLCDVFGVAPADATVLDDLARLELIARRLGCELRIVNTTPELRELVELAGLSDVLTLE